MVETNRNPHHYYPSDCIVPRMDYAKVIHCMFPEITAKNIFFSLKMMKFLTNAMVYNNSGKRRLLAAIVTRIAGRKRSAAVLEYFYGKGSGSGVRSSCKGAASVILIRRYGKRLRTLRNCSSYPERRECFQRDGTAPTTDRCRENTACWINRELRQRKSRIKRTCMHKLIL